tara:strand:+ start:228 stop:449 length:222 start_codon:yes stop_codon:yes gene_type:complete
MRLTDKIIMACCGLLFIINIISMLMISDMEQNVKDIKEQVRLIEKKRDYRDLVDKLSDPWFESQKMKDNLDSK